MSETQVQVRASDAERQAVADQLRGALTEGRLTLDEYDERLQQAYAARTRADLTPLLADLPVPTASAPLPASRRAHDRHRHPHHRFPGAAGVRAWLAFAMLLTTIWALSSISTGHLHVFWPAWPLAISGVILAKGRFHGHHRL